jgi:hypothetical protein
MTNNGMVQMVGYDYMVDVTNRAVYRNDGRQVKEIHNTAGRHFKLTRKDGVRRSVGVARAIYAAMLGINPDDIPSSVCVVQDGDQYRMMYRTDMNIVVHQITRDDRVKEYRNLLNEKMTETQLLLDYYDNGNAAPVIKYITEQHRRLAAYVSKTFHAGYQRAHDIASEATEELCHRVVTHQYYGTTILPTLRFYARNIIKKNGKTMAMPDRIKRRNYDEV